MHIPPQGFRHAARLLLSGRVRQVPPNAPELAVVGALEQLARDLVALSDDMHAHPDALEWLRLEFTRTVDGLPHRFDRARVKAAAAAILAGAAARRTPVERRDLFLVYVPEDRLPVAAPLAIELTKRRVSVAFSEYEVESADELEATVLRGLEHHLAGAVLWTSAFARTGWSPTLPDDERLRIIRPSDTLSTMNELAAFVRRARSRWAAK
jgi:hypothetical protein